MPIKKKLPIIAAGLATVGVVTAVGTGVVNAATQTSSSTSLVDKIAQKFNLKSADVQAVFDQNRQEHEAQHEQEEKTRLDQAVKDGKLTQDQETKLIAKQAELKTYRDSLKDKTEDERRTAMKAKMDEFKQWLKDNGISEDIARPAHGGRGGDGPHMGPM